MFAVVYRWRLQPGMEQGFIDGWHRVTAAIHAQCGSYGSRLHRADDGTWVAYARWPDEETRAQCGTPDPEGLAMMREAVAEGFPEIRMEIVDDMLAEPVTTLKPANGARLVGEDQEEREERDSASGSRGGSPRRGLR